eukprot:scaffold7557_cov122-Skeletonema_dohrnii-CCMP3373.AAC.6
MVAIARRLITCVDVPLLGRLEDEERGARERKPMLAVEAARVVVWCWVVLEAAWRTSLRRTVADVVMVEAFLESWIEVGWGFVADCRRAFLIPFSHAASFAFRFATRPTHSFSFKERAVALLALLLLSSLAASVQNITMGVPAGPKLDFVGASEVRD